MVALDWMLAGMLSYSEKLRVIIFARVFPGGGEGGTLIFSYIRRLKPFLRFKIMNFYIF